MTLSRGVLVEAGLALTDVAALRVDAVRVVRTRHARGRRTLVDVGVTIVALPTIRAAARAAHSVTGHGVLHVARALLAAALTEGAGGAT